MAKTVSRTSRGKATLNPIKPGDRFGRLVALDGGQLIQLKRQRETFIKVRCDCGVEKLARAASLKEGATASCGCGVGDSARIHIVARSTTHGMSKTAIYGVYRTMLSRCYNPKVERYPMYGGRGVKVCDRWRGDGGFERFVQDMGERPKGCSIERDDHNGDYEPTNCRWADSKEQANNTRRNHVIYWRGEALSASQWASKTGIPAASILWRIKAGWPVDRALSEKLRGSGG